MSFNFAVSNSQGLLGQRKLVENARNLFLGNSQDPLEIRSIVYDSWLRCLEFGIDPGCKRAQDPLNIENIRNMIACSEVYEFSALALRELLIQAKETKYILTLSDAQGRIIFLDGDRRVKQQAECINFVLGSNWSEQAIGTNAIGTSLETGQPVQIYAAEHFCAGIQDWVCSSSPIRHPITNEVLGAIDLTGPWKEAQAHTLGIVAMAAKVIENRFSEQALTNRNHLLERYAKALLQYPQNGIIVFDSVFKPIQANPVACKFLKQATGKGWETLCADRQFCSSLAPRPNSIQPGEEYEFIIKQYGIPALIQEVYAVNKRIGCILILRSSDILSSPDRKATVKASQANSAWDKIIGKSKNILSAMSKCNLVASRNVPVLLLGESGSGKELFAQAIHKISVWRKGPFMALNCGAIPKELLASELFGYEAGTFTGADKAGKRGKFEQAHGGTLFLDEVGEMPLEFQVHLLRVLQEREIVRLGGSIPIPVDVRIIAATHQNLEQLVQNGLFRADFYYRLQVISIDIPPLRERREDIPLLIDHFLEQLMQRYGKPQLTLDKQVREFLVKAYKWPGNVRELQNSLEHAMLFCANEIIKIEDFPYRIQSTFSPTIPYKNQNTILNKKKLPLTQEKETLLNLLRVSGGNLSAAARQLGIARTTLYRHLNKCGISKMRW